MDMRPTEDELDLAAEEFKKTFKPLRKLPKDSYPFWKA